MKIWVKKNKHWLLLIAFIICIFFYTVIGRPEQISYNRLNLFWSYKEAFINRNIILFKEIFLNIGMFVPVGYMLSCALTRGTEKSKTILSGVLGIITSSLIESSQYFFFRGSAELDDIISNTIGAILGCVLCNVVCKIQHEKFNNEKFCSHLSILFVLIAILFCATMDSTADSILGQLAFQASNVEIVEDELQIDGFCFTYGYDLMDENAKLLNSTWDDSDYNIVLRSLRTKTLYSMDTITSISKPFINKYFKSKFEYPQTGYKAKIGIENINLEDEYEVMIKSGRLTVSGNTFVKNGKLEKTPEEENVELDVVGTDLERIVNNGYLKAYNPEAGISIYQYGMNLLWIANDKYVFNITGKSEIEYRVWTTQPDRIREGHNDDRCWDDKGFMFEDKEITNKIDCGKYRVASMRLPDEYSIAFITTGSMADGGWKWASNFRPRY